MMFDELGFVDNPALSLEVERYLKKLERQRREAPAQVEGFREWHYQAVVESLGKALKGEMGLRKELSAATDIFMIGMMFDGLLRRSEMAAAASAGRVPVLRGEWSSVGPLFQDGSVRKRRGHVRVWKDHGIYGQDERVEAYARTGGDGR